MIQPYNQLWRLWWTQQRLGVSAVLAFFVTIVSIPHALTKERSLDKFLTLLCGAASLEIARRSTYGYFDFRDTDADINYTEKRALIQQHKHNLKDTQPMALIPANVEEAPDMITNVAEYWVAQEKHLLVVGGTGSGKSTFIKNLCKNLYGWSCKVYDIDATVDDWKFASAVHYDMVDIEQQMKDDLNLIPSIREERRLAGKNWQPAQSVLMVADEFPALIGEFPTTAKKWLATHAKQTRKHRRMIAIMAQNDTVSNLGLKGDVSIRDTCFTCVYLGDKAYEQAKSVGKPELVDWLRKVGYSGCMVDDKPAWRP